MERSETEGIFQSYPASKSAPPLVPPCGRSHVLQEQSKARLRGPRREASNGAPSDPALRAGPPPPLSRGEEGAEWLAAAASVERRRGRRRRAWLDPNHPPRLT